MNLPVDYTLLSADERREVRAEYVRLQEGNCFYCLESLEDSPPKIVLAKKINWGLFPMNFLKYPIHLQHDHDSGLTEGAVHAYCNAVLWQYEGR